MFLTDDSITIFPTKARVFLLIEGDEDSKRSCWSLWAQLVFFYYITLKHRRWSCCWK